MFVIDYFLVNQYFITEYICTNLGDHDAVEYTTHGLCDSLKFRRTLQKYLSKTVNIWKFDVLGLLLFSGYDKL